MFIAQKQVLRSIIGLSSTNNCKTAFVDLKILTTLFKYVWVMYAFIFFKTALKILFLAETSIYVSFKKFNITYKSPDRICWRAYNLLPVDIKSASIFKCFKEHLKFFLLKKNRIVLVIGLNINVYICIILKYWNVLISDDCCLPMFPRWLLCVLCVCSF